MSTIGVNLLWLVPGVVGGSEEYTLRLLRALPSDGLERLDVRVYGSSRLFEVHPDLRERFDTRVAPTGLPRGVGSKLARVGVESTWLAAVSRDDDLVHHAGGVVPLVRSGPSVLTIHDLQPLEMPQHFSAVKRRWLATMLPRSVRAARRVLCPSRFTADRIGHLLGVPASRIDVIPHPLDGSDVGVVDPVTDERLRSRFGRYLLLPAIAYPHKRHADLLHALRHLQDRFADLSVVLTGRPGPVTPELESLARRLGLDGRVHNLGRVSEDELDALYRSATALVFPSEYEGFGNPVLEAMVRGCPVVAADAAALPEVAGPAALLVPVGNPVALSEAVARLLTEPSLAGDLVEAGARQASVFSATSAADRLLDCYRRALPVAG